MVDRRGFLNRLGLATLAPGAYLPSPPVAASGAATDGVILNDVHSKLNATRVVEVARPASRAALVAEVSSPRGPPRVPPGSCQPC